MSSEVPAENVNDPIYKPYFLNCKTKFIKKNVSEDIGKGIVQQYMRKLVILIPQESDQRTLFLKAWMPETREEFHEFAAELGAPVHGPSRLSVHMGHDDKCDRPYLFVMSKGVEDVLNSFPEDTLIKVKTLPANHEDAADYAADSDDGNYDAVEQ
jgi:hypothetical protein